MEYEVLSHTAETGIKAYGQDLSRAFASAAAGMFSIVTDLNLITPTQETKISLRSSSEKELLVDWLNELLFHFETKGLVFNQFDVQITNSSLRGTAKGEVFSEEKFPLKTQIKAVTYHNLKIKEEDKETYVQVFFDV